ncbi:MAG: hypothetical protein HYV29_02320 [Ignavibacteriales bacterium]|nr:hypothetical protein [Ignavibacteriales bacterium]
MKKRITLITVFIAIAFSLTPSQDADYYEIQEHGPGRWLTFTTQLSVQHKLTTPGILEYGLVFNPDFEIRQGRDPLFVFKFEEEGTFNPALKPQLPANTHMQFIVDGKPTAELAVKKTSFRNENDLRHVLKFYVVANRQIVENMIAARSVRGLLYYRQLQGTDVQKNDVKSFTLDPKSIRTLARLMSIAR